MSTINDDDKFLIQRGSSSYQIDASNLMSSINDDDLLLIQRGQDSYNVAAVDIKDQLGGPSGYFDTPVEVLTPLNGAGLNAGETYEPISTAVVEESGGVITFTDSTELEKIIGPVRMVDENGDIKTPATSQVASVGPSTTTFKPVLYTGSGGTQSITGFGFSPDLVWCKARTTADSHVLYDTIRGAGNNKS